MSEKQIPFVHPFTQFLVNTLTIIYNDISQGPGNIKEAARDLAWLIYFLDSKGQTALEEDRIQLENMVDSQTIDKQAFRRSLSRIMKELHREGYFLEAKVRPPTRESTLRDFEIELAKSRYGHGEG